MNGDEEPVVFERDGEDLVGIIHRPAEPGSRGVVLVVGGPQYRVGSHRQFVLLARALARRGIPVLRFDYRGMGDSGGDRLTFEDIGSDIKSAVDQLCLAIPAVEEVVIWGLCDAASAALFYAHRDPRITGLILLNPWVRSEAGLARVYVRHYYLSRLRSRDFWRHTLTDLGKLRAALDSLRVNLVKLLPGSLLRRQVEGNVEPQPEDRNASRPLALRMEDGLREFRNGVLIILSGNDLTASEFKDLVKTSKGWRRLLQRTAVTLKELPAANHTFSKRIWRDQVEVWTVDWVESL